MSLNSQQAHHHLFVFFSLGVAYDNKPRGSSSFFSFFLKCRKRWWTSRLIIISWFFPSNAKNDNELGGYRFVVISWVFFSNVSSRVASPSDASLLYLHVHGDVTTPFLSHHTPASVSKTLAQNPCLTYSCKYFQILGYNHLAFLGHHFGY